MAEIRQLTVPRIILFISIILIFTGTATLNSYAQEKLPVRNYTNPAEMISLGKDMSFGQAVDILNTFAQKYDKKFIVNKSSAKGSIGVSLPSMYWYDALKYITNLNGVEIVPHEKYYELIDAPENKTQGNASPQNNQNQSGVVTTDTREVRISATFFEGNRDALQELGIDWSTFANGTVQVNSNSASDVINNKQFSINLSPLEIGKSGINVQALFKAFESKDLGQIISQPNIKVMNGEEGHIQVGQTFFINQKDFAGNTVSKSYNVGTILTVTPHVIIDNDTTFVYMKLEVQRSSLSPNTTTVTVNQQLAQSDIMLLSGESTVIAGLYETQISHTRKGIPILKDLPPWFFGLRYIFGYNSKTYSQQELIIIIKATIDPDIAQRMKSKMKSAKELLDQERRNMKNDNKKANHRIKF